MSTRPVRIIQLSDAHIFADADMSLLGVNTQASFKAVIDLIKQQVDVTDFITLSGDLSQDGSVASYVRLAADLTPLNLPVFWLPGNHDNIEAMKQVYPRDTISNNKHIVLEKWHIILLSSQLSGRVEGHLDQGQLLYFEECMKAYPDHYAIVMFHHQPFEVGCEWLDKLGLNNAATFWEVATRYSKLKLVLFGHIHQELEKKIGGICCYSTPSTCFQFKADQPNFGLEKLPPGFRVVELYDNGKFETRVLRTAEYVGVFDENALGY